MADFLAQWPIEVVNLKAEILEAPPAASLRYFSGTGPFAQAVARTCNVGLPATGMAVSGAAGDPILAWRSPTETVMLAAESSRLASLSAALAATGDGCLVELTGGLEVLRLSGPHIADLLCRLGGTGSVPRPGESRRSRLAEVPVLTLSLRENETLLLVDRVYLPHLAGWIRETLLDFAA